MALRVLIVQSDPKATQTLTQLFEKRGDEIWHTDQFEEALVLMDLVRPHLLLLDLHFPGDEWSNFLKNSFITYPNLKIIMTNRFPDLTREVEAQQTGVRVFLRQPFTSSWLERALQHLDGDEQKALTQPAKRLVIPLWLKNLALSLIMILVVFTVFNLVARQKAENDLIDGFEKDLAKDSAVYLMWMDYLVEEQVVSLTRIVNDSSLQPLWNLWDGETAPGLLEETAIRQEVEALEVLSTDSVILLSLRASAGMNSDPFSVSSGDTFFQDLDFVRIVVQGLNGGDQTQLIYGAAFAPWGNYYYVGQPVQDASGTFSAVVLVGRSLESLTAELETQMDVEAMFYDHNGKILYSSSPLGAPDVPFPTVQEISVDDSNGHIRRWKGKDGADYMELLIPWRTPSGRQIGLMGVVQPLPALEQSWIYIITEPILLILFIVCMLFIILTSLYVVRQVTEPLEKLENAFIQVNRGNYEVKVEAPVAGEFSDLFRSFNYMIARFQETLLLRDLFPHTMPYEDHDAAMRAINNGKLFLQGVSRQAVVLGLSITNLDVLMAASRPKTLMVDINALMAGIADTVQAEGGYVDMTDGGRLRAVFGIIPEEANMEANIRAACRSSFSLMQTLRSANAARRRRGEEIIEIFAVIHAGSVVAGATGRRGQQHYCIVGETSETAWRISSFAGNGLPMSGVFMEKNTFRDGQIADAGIKFESRGLFSAGGQGESLEIMQILSECKQKSSSSV